MLQRDVLGDEAKGSPPTGLPHFTPKAKSVIWLFMNGGVSHLESFDPKPMVAKYAGKTIAETPFADVQNPKKLAIERLIVPDANREHDPGHHAKGELKWAQNGRFRVPVDPASLAHSQRNRKL